MHLAKHGHVVTFWCLKAPAAAPEGPDSAVTACHICWAYMATRVLRGLWAFVETTQSHACWVGIFCFDQGGQTDKVGLRCVLSALSDFGEFWSVLATVFPRSFSPSRKRVHFE